MTDFREPPYSKWTTSVDSILADTNLFLLKKAIETDWVFGWHLHYYGGRGADIIAFQDWQAYRSYIEGSRPGDRFILWSVGQLRSKGLILAEKSEGQNSSHQKMLEALEAAVRYLAQRPYGPEGLEVVAVRRCGSGDGLEIRVFDIELLEELREFLESAQLVGDRWCVLPFTEVDPPKEKARPEYLLVDAKRPNDSGAVPISGYY